MTTDSLADLRARMAPLLAKPPAGWQHWSSEAIVRFRETAAKFQRAGSVHVARAAATEVVSFYGKTLGQALSMKPRRAR